MSLDKRNHKIVEHLRTRFLERWGVELTRTKRMSLLNQIQAGSASLTTRLKSGIELWKVRLYNQELYTDQSYIVMYDKTIRQIMTVLPPLDSEEFNEFCERVSIPKEQLVAQQLTAKERTMESVNRAAKMRTHQAEVRQGMQYLTAYNAINSYMNQKRINLF